MKKSLSLLLAFALVFSMFSSLALAADELTTEQKYDAVGIFAGINGERALDQPMTRAQAARVTALLLNLDGIGDPDTKVVTEKPFTDVELGTWYVEEIAAVKEAGLFVGKPDGSFGPNDNITIQELAVVLVNILGLEPVEGAEVEGAAAWAAPYVKALQDNGVDFPTNYTDNALRRDLVEATYTAAVTLGLIESADKVSVVSANPVGIQKVEVKLNKAVDSSKAKFELKRGNAVLETEAKFSDDKKTVVLELTTAKISAGDYTVTLSGLEEDEIANASATFTAEDEKVASIEFITASDTIAYSEYATVKLAALNQYGEPVSIGAGNFTAFVNGQNENLKKDGEGNLVLTFDVTAFNLVQGNSIVPVQVYHNDTRVSVQKNFNLGVVPMLSKVEVGEVKYSNGSSLSAADETATIPLYLYDQYGNPVVQEQMEGTPPEISPSLVNVMISPYSPNLEWDDDQLWDNDGNAQAVVKLTGKEDKSTDYNVTVYAGSDNKVVKVSVSAGKLANKVEFGTFNGVIAEGDTKDFYIPIIAYDANGNELSAQDIVDNDKADRFTFSGSNVTNLEIVEFGEHKGKLKFNLDSDAKARSSVYLTALIASANANSYVQTTIPVQEQRYPDRIVVKDEPAAKAILGASTKVKFQLKDQYGEDLGNIPATVTTANGQTYSYQVKVEVSGDTATSGITAKDNLSRVYDDTNKSRLFNNSQFDNFNEEITINTTDGSTGKVTLKAVIQRKTDKTNWVDFSTTVSRSVEAIKSDADLTFELASLGTIYAMIDKKPEGTTATDHSANGSFFAKELEVTAKDSSGSKVAIPTNRIASIVAENPSIVDVHADNETAFVLGNKAGETTVTAVVYTNKGVHVTLTSKVTVSDQPIYVAELKADNATATYNGSQDSVFDFFNHLIVKDQYGVEYKSNGEYNNTNPIVKYQKLLGIRYSVTSKNAGVVDIDPVTGQIKTISADAQEFVITATSPNGKSVSVLVTR
jgi:hypothetical protein